MVMAETYVDRIAKQIGEKVDMDFDGGGRGLLRMYALLCLVVGERVTSENVHDAWTAWRIEDDPEHRSAIPFSELHFDVQMLDDEYRDAIRAVATTLPTEVVR